MSVPVKPFLPAGAPRSDRPPVRPVSPRWKLVLALLTVIAWAPLVCVLLAAAVASAFGCTLNEASAHPCVVGGWDIGEALVVMFLMGWVAIFVFPLMILSIVGWLIVWLRRARRNGSMASD